MGLFEAIGRETHYMRHMLRILGGIKKTGPGSGKRVPDHIEATVEKHADRTAFHTDEGEISYRQFDAFANRVARWARAQGLKPGDCVALFMSNRWEYVAIWYGLSKVGVVTALINSQLFGHSLAHCIKVGEAKCAIIDGHRAEAYVSAQCETPAWVYQGSIEGPHDFGAALETYDDAPADKAWRSRVQPGDPVLKMYTSGTTGLPKAALMTHIRALYYLNVFAITAQARPDDRMMMVLPLYHATGGLCGVGCALSFGGSLVIRDKFSASAFWPDVKRFKATLFMYVGELCRFLVNSPETPEEKDHTLRCAIGNGMRRDVWDAFQARFDLEQIIEFYGSTEGNVGLVNATNQPGAIGRIPSYLKKRFNIELVAFDIENEKPIRGADGFCRVAENDEVGEALGRIDPNDARFRFDGYGSAEDTAKKILRNVFEPGDAWFRTGDLMTRDAIGYYYFVDRIGDTFRWKAENVATGEVAEAYAHPGVSQANIYGVEVPGYPGRAGMASLVVEDGLDLAALRSKVHAELPAYARPLFLRLQEETDTTGTFKFRKVDLVREGFDPANIDEPLYLDHPEEKAYVALTPELHAGIIDGSIRL
jgi:fatty-acyl-CoA synthase